MARKLSPEDEADLREVRRRRAEQFTPIPHEDLWRMLGHEVDDRVPPTRSPRPRQATGRIPRQHKKAH